MTADATLDGYDGPADLVAQDAHVAVRVRLRGLFSPLDGRYHWYGRVAADADVDALVGSGASVVLETPQGAAPGRLSDRDPWGRYRVAGTGRPPFRV
jgi:beta-galactosidase GanA